MLQTLKRCISLYYFRVSSFFLRAYFLFCSFFYMDCASKISLAIASYCNCKYSSIRANARAFSLFERTLRRYLTGGVSRSASDESEQYLSPAEENILIKYTLRLDSFGNPISPAFTRKLYIYRRLYEYRLDPGLYAGELALLVDYEGVDFGFYRVRVAHDGVRARNEAYDAPTPPPSYQRTFVASYG